LFSLCIHCCLKYLQEREEGQGCSEWRMTLKWRKRMANDWTKRKGEWIKVSSSKWFACCQCWWLSTFDFSFYIIHNSLPL
jgi:hypothetical protein